MQIFNPIEERADTVAAARTSEDIVRPGYLTTLGFSLFILLPACSSTPDGDDAGTGGTTATAGSGGAPIAGKSGSGGSFAGSTGIAGSPGGATFGGAAGSGASAGRPSAGGPGAGGSSAGAPSGGAPSAGSGGTTPVAGASGSGGSSGGTPGTAGALGTAGSGGTPNPVMSGLPVPPGEANVPKPTGTGDTITVVPWAGFKAAVTYSFDDNTGSQLAQANWDKLMGLDVPFTFFLWTGQQSANDAKWTAAFQKGHEMANHTKSHQSAASGADIDAATDFIKNKFGVQPYTMAAPNGDRSYTSAAMGKFIINRGVSNAVIMPNGNSDPFTLPTYIPPTGAGAGPLDGEVNSARSSGGWRTMCIHGFQGANDGAYQPISIDGFVTHVTTVKGYKDVWIGTMTDVGAYWLGEKAVRAATSMTMGTDKTWTWTLPANFPPKKYLRVKVAGGTLKQNGAALAWDPHGYYEISLDAKSVTLSP